MTTPIETDVPPETDKASVAGGALRAKAGTSHLTNVPTDEVLSADDIAVLRLVVAAEEALR